MTRNAFIHVSHTQSKIKLLNEWREKVGLISNIFNGLVSTATQLNRAIQSIQTVTFDANSVKAIPTSVWVTAITQPSLAPSLMWVSVAQWSTLFNAVPDLPNALVGKLGPDQLAFMHNAFVANPAMTRQLTASQLEAYFEKHGTNALTTSWNPVVIQSLNNPAFAQALSALSAEKLSKISKQDWDRLNTYQPNLKNQVALPIQELLAEANKLPLASAKQLQTLIQNHSLDVYENGMITAKDLCTQPWVGQAFQDGNALIALYDQNFNQISQSPASFDAITSLYSNTLSRMSLSTQAVAASVLPSLSQQLMGFLTTAHNTMMPAVPPATGSDVKAYVSTVNSNLKNEIGKFKNVGDLMGQISFEVNNLNQMVLDNTTKTKFDPKVTQWLLDGAPIGATEGNLSYLGKNGLTFSEAVKTAVQDLFIEADQFAVLCNKGIAQVVANKSVADSKILISQIFDVIGGVASLGAGLGKTYTALQSLSGSANQIKAVSELSADLNIASTLIKNQTHDWLKPGTSAVTGNLAYNQFNHSIADLDQALSVFSMNDSKIQTLKNQFMTDYKSLVKTMADQLNKGKEQLATATCRQTYTLDEYVQFGPYKNETYTMDVVNFYGNHQTARVYVNDEALNKSLYQGAQIINGPQIDGYLFTQWQVESTQTPMIFIPELAIQTVVKAYGYNVI